MSKRNYFGTDGIRGQVGQWPITAEFMLKLGRAAGVGIGPSRRTLAPAVAYLTRSLRASAGIVISASHNPHQDNGIKFFSAAGE
ncbi:MAG TPA: phosphoglucosamine mutase, partial [Tahibacter sp.]|nr:phosphoglucosamine mutase [Tahibacter sp.]